MFGEILNYPNPIQSKKVVRGHQEETLQHDTPWGILVYTKFRCAIKSALSQVKMGIQGKKERGIPSPPRGLRI